MTVRFTRPYPKGTDLRIERRRVADQVDAPVRMQTDRSLRIDFPNKAAAMIWKLTTLDDGWTRLNTSAKRPAQPAGAA